MSDPLTVALEIAGAAIKVLGAVAPDALEMLRNSGGRDVDAAIAQARGELPPRWDTAKEDEARRKAVLERKRAAAAEYARTLGAVGGVVLARPPDGNPLVKKWRAGTLLEVDIDGERARVSTESALDEGTWFAFDDVKSK